MIRWHLYMSMHFSLQMAGANMAVSTLLLLTAVTDAAVVLTDSTLTTDKLHTVLCVWTVAHTYFATGSPLVVSLPRTTPDDARSALSNPLPRKDDLKTEPSYCESYLREQDGRLNCSDQAEMILQTHQFYTTVTFYLCGTKRRAA